MRQLKDRQELFVDGETVIRLGKHRFNINTQPLDLTVVHRDGRPVLHLTGTKYFDPITDEAYLATRDVWESGSGFGERATSTAPSISPTACCNHCRAAAVDASPPQLRLKRGRDRLTSAATSAEVRLALVQEFMATRYQEGYTKGIHDLDGARIFHALLSAHVSLKLARYEPAARACAVVFWHRFCPAETVALWSAKLGGFAARNKLFPGDPTQQDYIAALQTLTGGFARQTQLFPEPLAAAAGEYLFHELITSDTFVVSREANDLVAAFEKHLVTKGSETLLQRRAEVTRQASRQRAGTGPGLGAGVSPEPQQGARGRSFVRHRGAREPTRAGGYRRFHLSGRSRGHPVLRRRLETVGGRGGHASTA